MHNTLESHKTWSYIHKHLPVHPLLLRNNRNSKKNTRACESSFVKSSCTKRPNISRSEFRYIPSSPPQVDLPSLSLYPSLSLSLSVLPKISKKETFDTNKNSKKKRLFSVLTVSQKTQSSHRSFSTSYTHTLYLHTFRDIERHSFKKKSKKYIE